MNITLRKASALQTAIQEHIKTIEVKAVVALNQFQGDAVLEGARQTAIDNDVRRAELTRVLYSIRAQVGDANMMTGITRKLAEAAFIDKRVGQLQAMISSENLQEDSAVINGKLEQLRNDKGETRSRIYGYHDTVNTGVFTAVDIANFKSTQQALKKEKQKINDEILELNVRTEITIKDSDRDILVKEGLI